MIVSYTDIITEIKSGKPDMVKIASDAENIMVDITSAKTDCTASISHKVNDMATCIKDIEDIVAKGKDIIA